MRNGLLLVAEQDIAGRVVAVWKRAAEDRVARPMQSNDLDTPQLNGAEFHGASPQEITTFIEKLPMA